MRKRYRILAFAALVAALIVPVGYALSLESTPAAKLAHFRLTPEVAATTVIAPVTVHGHQNAPGHADYFVPDAAKLLGVGTVLLGLAAALRKSSQN